MPVKILRLQTPAIIFSDSPPNDTSVLWYDTVNDVLKYHNPDSDSWEKVVPDLVRANITDFWDAPFWDNIPDKPTGFQSLYQRFKIIEAGSYTGGQTTDTYSYHVEQTCKIKFYFELSGYGNPLQVRIRKNGGDWQTVFSTSTGSYETHSGEIDFEAEYGDVVEFEYSHNGSDYFRVYISKWQPMYS